MEDITTKAGFVARARKAIIAGVAAFASAFSPAIVLVTGDGALTADEVVPVLVASAGLGLAAFVAVYGVPNAPAGDGELPPEDRGDVAV